MTLVACRASPPEVRDCRAVCKGCNLVLVTFDALRADHLGAYGYELPTSPRLDELAEDAWVFENHLAQSGSTVSAVPSMLTSRYPYLDRLLTSKWTLDEGETTLAELLRARGYHTAAVLGHDYVKRQWGIAQGFDVFDDRWSRRETALRTGRRAAEQLQALPEPYFLWVHFKQPHGPYYVEPRELQPFYEGPGPTLRDHSFEEVRQAFAAEPLETYSVGGKRRTLTPTMRKQLVGLYDASIALADMQLGVLLDAVQKKSGRDRTIVAVTADHGEALGEQQRVDHNSLQHVVLRTPLVLRLPCGQEARRTDPTMALDLVPTLLARLGVTAPAGVRGRDLAEPAPADRPQYAEYEHQRYVVLGRETLRRSESRDELFDLSSDPGEAHDLAVQRPERARALGLALDALVTGAGGEAAIPADSFTIEKLRSLGYIE